MNNGINPITQRCKTISGDHHWEIMRRVGYYYGVDGGKYAQDQIVYLNNKQGYRCKACDLIDDLFEGKFS